MSTQITWKIAQLERLYATGEIQTIHYTVDATDGTNTYHAGAYGSIKLDPADSNNMIPFADVTESEVINWLQAKIGDEQIASISAVLEAQLVEQRQPTTAHGLPWDN